MTLNQSLSQSYDFNAEKQSWEEGAAAERSSGFNLVDTILRDFGKYFYEQDKR